MPLTATGQFYPGQRRGVPFRFPGMQGNNGDPGIYRQGAPQPQQALNGYLNSRGMAGGMQTAVDYSPGIAAGAFDSQQSAAQQWWRDTGRDRPPTQSMTLLAGGPQSGPQPGPDGRYQYGPFSVSPTSPFAPGGSWGQYFNAPSLSPFMPERSMQPMQPPMGMGESTQQRGFAPPPAPAPMMGGPGPAGMAPSMAPQQIPEFGAASKNMQAFTDPMGAFGATMQMMNPMGSNPGYSPPAYTPPPPQSAYQQADRSSPAFWHGAYGATNPSATPGGGAGADGYVYDSNNVAPMDPRTQAWVGRQMQSNQTAGSGPYDNAYGRFDGLASTPQPNQQPLQRPDGGTTLGGGSVVVNMPDGRQAVIGPRMANEARSALGPDATPQQVNDLMATWYAGSQPGEQGFDTNRVGAMNQARGGHMAAREYSPEQRWDMMASAATARGIDPGQFSGDYAGLADAVRRQGVAERSSRRHAADQARHEQLQQRQEIRRESILEGKYGDAAKRRFAIEDELRRKSADGTAGQLDKSDMALIGRFKVPNASGGTSTDYAGLSRGFYDRYRDNPALAWQKMMAANMTSQDLADVVGAAQGGFFGGGDAEFAGWLGAVAQASGGVSSPAQGGSPPQQPAPQPRWNPTDPVKSVLPHLPSYGFDPTNPFNPFPRR